MKNQSVIAHTSYDDDDDKNPKNHIKIKIAAAKAAVISFTAFSHCELLLSAFCNIYYDKYKKIALCPNVILEFFAKIGYNRSSDIFLGR